MTVDSFLQRDRLIKLLDDLALYGARSDGGVNRQALTMVDFESRRFLIDQARSIGLEVTKDAMANLFFRLPGTSDKLSPVAIGSHSDSQPSGGRFDGAFGVCAALEVAYAISSSGRKFARSLDVVSWTNEEGCRFAPGSMGALSFVQPERFATFRDVADRDGRTVAQELEVESKLFSDVPLRAASTPFHAFLEAHIEQGPILEQTKIPVGIVRGIQGARWYEVKIRGEAAHAGCTPRQFRRDAFRYAVDLASELYEILDQGDDDLRVTIGSVSVVPGSVNVIPNEVILSIDLRHPLLAVLDDIERRLKEFSADIFKIQRTMSITPLEFPAFLRDMIERAAGELGIKTSVINSGAFHDSVYLARHCPTAMIFVPSAGGISHNPKEFTAPDDLFAGARVLAQTTVALLES